MSRADAPTETHEGTRPVQAVTVCGLHHAGAALAAAHPSDHSVGGQVHPRASGNRSRSSHIRRRGSVLRAGCWGGRRGGKLNPSSFPQQNRSCS